MLAAALVALAGCERLPWATGKDAAPAEAQPAQKPSLQLNDPGVLAIAGRSAVIQEIYKRRVEALPDDHPSGFMTSFGSVRIVQRKPKTMEEKRILVEELAKEELLVQDAVSLGLERDPKVARQLDDSRRLVLISALTTRDTERAQISDDEIKEHYERFKQAYKEPERIRVRQIATSTLEEAEVIRTNAVQGGDFAQLARDRSIGPGKEQGGELGWHVKAVDHQLLSLSGQTPVELTFFPQLEAVAFSLEVGQVSQPVKGPDNHYYVVKLEERKAEQIKPLTELWDQLRDGLLMQKRQQLVQEHLDRLWREGAVKLNEQRLEAL